MRKIFSDEQVQFIKDNYRIMSCREIADRLGGVTERQVRSKANGIGLKKNREFKSDYFYLIDSANRAYWLGLLYADGWVVNNEQSKTYELAIELTREDAYILQKFADELGGVHSIRYLHHVKDYNGYHYETDSAVLRIYSKEIVNDLIKHGVVERKTNSKLFPKSGVFLRDFVRGYLDGDGCIYLDRKGRNLHTIVHFTCGCEEFLKYLNYAIECELGIRGTVYKEKEHKYRLMFFRQNDVRMILDWIYYDNTRPMLIRKYNKYIEAYGLAA